MHTERWQDDAHSQVGRAPGGGVGGSGGGREAPAPAPSEKLSGWRVLTVLHKGCPSLSGEAERDPGCLLGSAGQLHREVVFFWCAPNF